MDVEKIKKYKKENPDQDVVGVVIKNRRYNQAFLQCQKHKCDTLHLECVCAVGKEISKLHAEKYFSPEEITEKKEVVFQEDTVDKYMVVIRKYLDLNIDGIYFEGDFSPYEMTEIQKAMQVVLREYPAFSVFYDTLGENTMDFGYFILKDTRIIEQFSKYAAFYYFSGEKAFGKEEKKYTKNLKFNVSFIDL